jgi:hypothetical protein
MELNHQVRSADPSLFVSGSAPSLTTLIANSVEEMRAAILRIPFHKSLPRLDSMALKSELDNIGKK